MNTSDAGAGTEQRAGALWSAVATAIPAEVVRRLSAGGEALEIGCGSGLACMALAQMFPAARVTGHDPDPQAIAEASVLARTARLDTRLRFAVGDSLRLPHAAFDLVVVSGVLGRPPDPRRLLNAIRNALVPEGSCLLLETAACANAADSDQSIMSLARAAGFSRCRSHRREGRIDLIELGR